MNDPTIKFAEDQVVCLTWRLAAIHLGHLFPSASLSRAFPAIYSGRQARGKTWPRCEEAVQTYPIGHARVLNRCRCTSDEISGQTGYELLSRLQGGINGGCAQRSLQELLGVDSLARVNRANIYLEFVPR